MRKLEKTVEIEKKGSSNKQTVNRKQKNTGININRKSRIEELKKKINSDDYITEAINKLANSLTAGLMK